MAEQETQGGTTANDGAQGAMFTVEKIYVKDASFEAPGAPQIFTEAGQPQLQLNLAQKVQRVADNAYEVVLGVTLTCTANEKTAYVAEVQQGGVFGLSGFDERGLDMMLGTHCPNVLFPYVRQAIGELVTIGGFPPFVLQPINFEALYAESMRQRAAQGEGAGLADAEAAGNA